MLTSASLRPRHLIWLSAVACTAGLVVTVYFAAVGNQGSSPFDVLLVLGTLVYPIVGSILVTRLPRNLVGWLLCFVGLWIGVLLAANGYAQYGLEHPGSLPAALTVAWVSGWTFTALLSALWLIPLVFPDGRLLSPRWRIFVATGVAFAVLAFVGNGLAPGPISAGQFNQPNPYAIHAPKALFSVIVTGAAASFLVTTLGSIASVVVRYRRSDRITRQQIKWFAVAAVLVPLPSLLHDVNQDVANVLFGIFIPLLPIAMGVSILRHGLYEIDIVINKALVYGALAAFVTAVYVALVIGIGSLVSGAGRFNLVLSIAATALVALVFQPLRHRLQGVANRLVYGRRSTPYEVLAEFTQRLGHGYALEAILPRMAQTLGEGTGAERADVWLKVGDALRPVAAWPRSTDAADAAELPMVGGELPAIPHADRAAPVRYQGELLGALSVRKPRSEPLTPVEEKLLDDLAHQAGLVLKNVGLTAELMQRLDELQASRQRLVTAQDEERRRIERNLHDGAQQQLVALKVNLGLAQALALKDPHRTQQMLQQLVADADESVQTLRDLAHGIYPPLLADRGLKAALDAQGRKSPLSVTVDAPSDVRYSPEFEAAIYFCCLEALQNAAKYSGAEHVTVTLRNDNGHVEFAVADDGRGYDTATVRRGAGLQNMADRLEAIGGSLSVESRPGEGTRVLGRLPAQPVSVREPALASKG